MYRILLIAAACALIASPAASQTSQDQQKQIQKRESSGEAASQSQHGGLKKDRQISQDIIRHAHARMRTHAYRSERYGH